MKIEFIDRGSGDKPPIFGGVKTAIKGAVKRSKVSRVTVHDLRRTAASRLLEAGADHTMIASILGHTDLRMI